MTGLRRREPFIGITCDVQVPRRRPEAWELLLDHRYAEAVKDAGGYPVLLPIARRPLVIQRYLEALDGVVIVGGEDVDPRLYGDTPKSGTNAVFGPRLEFEKRLYRLARSRRNHSSRRRPHHDVHLEPGSRLRRIVGRETISVHSEHHQAASRLAPGFRPVAFAPDGIVEAIEGEDESILAVQWHPERTLRSPASRQLFRAFVRLTARRAAGR